MNNRIQQRFDKSIRDAVEITKEAEQRAKDEVLAKKIAQVAKEIPVIEHMIGTGLAKGRILTKDEIQTLKDMLKFKQQIVGTYA